MGSRQEPLRPARDLRSGDIAQVIELEIVIERRVPGIVRTTEKKRVAVRRRSRDEFGCEAAAGARSVLDKELLTYPLREPLADEARIKVGVPGVLSPPGSRRTVREPLDSYGSHCSAVAMT
jgi:hypothetical protein